MPEAPTDANADDGEMFTDDPGGYYVEGVYVPPPPPRSEVREGEIGTRLLITNITNINFKSYAGTKVLGPLHKSFTAIVGPNGSGKSNVIDSMLFVFGFRASKLRLKKLSSLIHKSDSFSDFDHCCVIVHFALIIDTKGDDYTVVEGSEFTISRTVHKNNQSYYKINDRVAQFRDVAQRLMSHGIDLRYNRFLILQGEVEQIALMKPKAENENDTGMLEFLEDIIGSNRLKAPINQLTAKLEAKNEIRAEKMNRVRTVQKEKDSLEKAKNEAVAYLEEENHLTLEKNKLYQVRKAEAADDMADVMKSYQRADVIYNQILEKNEKFKESSKEGEENLKLLQEKIKDATKQADDLKEEFTATERKDAQLRTKAKHAQEKKEKLNKQLETVKKELLKLESLPEKLQDEIEEYEKEKYSVEKKKLDLETKLSISIEEMKSETIPLQEKKDKLQAEMVDLQSGVNDARSNLNIIEEELNLLLNKERAEKAKLDQLKLKYDSNATTLAGKKEALEEFESRMPQSEVKVGQLTDDLQKVESEMTIVNNRLSEKSGKLNELRSSLSSSTSRSHVLQFLMDQKRQGNITGIYGRLGDLGAIDKKYDVAISTACGPLDNIVTDTMQTAIKCTELLRKNEVGSATFIALDKMDRSRYQDRINTPENVPRLFDLITVKDPDVLPAFYFALRDTLVADDLNQATRIGLGGRTRWRVVTLEGKMVETSGAMSGGGRPSRGRMGTSIVSSEGDEREIEQLEKEVKNIQQQYHELKDQREMIHAELKKNAEALDRMKVEKPKFEMDLKMAADSQANLLKLIKEQEKIVSQVAPDEHEVEILKDKVKELEEIYQDKEKNVTSIKEKVKTFSDQIEQIFESKVGSVKKEIESSTGRLTELSNKISKTNVALKMNARNVEKSQGKIKNLETELEASIKLIEESKKEIESMNTVGKEAVEKYQAALEVKEKLEEECKTESQKLKKLEKKEMELRAELMDAKNELDSQKSFVDERSSHVNHWQAKIDLLKLNEIDGKTTDCELPVIKEEELNDMSAKSIEKEIDRIKKALDTMKPNMAAIGEFKKKQQIWLERVKELEEVTAQRNKIKEQLDELKNKRLEEFKEGFFVVSRKLKEIYRALTSGGDAGLEWVDSLDPFSEGIDFTVRPNKKTWKRITNLSGGEKTLSSLALIFAVHHFKPSPLYIMDEIDAALDFKNVSLVGNYVKQKTRNTQFLIISLRYNMYELADRLVGIYKVHNATKSVTLNPSQIGPSVAS